MSEPSTHRVALFIASHDLDAEIVHAPEGTPTVALAAAALGVDVDQIIKTLVFVSPEQSMVIGIARGTGRIDRVKLAEAAGASKLKLAPSDRVLEETGYPAGGVAPVDLPTTAIVVVDERVIEQEEVFGGAGTDLHMLRIRTADVIRLNRAIVARIVQPSEP